jgi:hypothetical protein
MAEHFLHQDRQDFSVSFWFQLQYKQTKNYSSGSNEMDGLGKDQDL